jgi:flavin-dependent dehydrogenase
VEQGAKVTATRTVADRSRTSAEVDSDAGTIRARWVIGADGPHSLARARLAEAARTKANRMPGMQAFRQYVDAPISDTMSVFFSADLLPGYGWIFPLPGGGANIGIGVHRDPAVLGVECRAALTNAKGRVALRGMAELYRNFTARADVRERLGGEVDVTDRAWAWPIPSDPDLGILGAGRILLCGDAAYLADPLTGEGIGQGLLSGRLAAECIAADGSPEHVQRLYRERIDRELGRDLRFARLMLNVVRHRRGIEWGLRVAGLTDWTRRNFARWMFEDYPRAYVFTPARWGEHSMHGKGAYQAARCGP